MFSSLKEIETKINRHYSHMAKRYYSSVGGGQKILQEARNRELIQFVTLFALSKTDFFTKAAFYGGTALRILYGLDRFSEDLDFTLTTPSLASHLAFDITPYLEAIQSELDLFGLNMTVEPKIKNFDTDVSSAFIKANTIQFNLSIGDSQESVNRINHNDTIKVKLEIDTNPPDYRFKTTKHKILVPQPFEISSIDIGELFSGKMHAALHRGWKSRVKGRDWYDVIWYLGQGVPLNIGFFQACMKQNRTFSQKEIISRNDFIEHAKKRINEIDWINAREDVEPFLTNREQTKALDSWSPEYFSSLIDQVRFTEDLASLVLIQTNHWRKKI